MARSDPVLGMLRRAHDKPRFSVRSNMPLSPPARTTPFGRNATERSALCTGLGTDAHVRPPSAVRVIVRDAAKTNNRFSSFVLGVVKSVPFEMRRADEVVTTAAGQPQ